VKTEVNRSTTYLELLIPEDAIQERIHEIAKTLAVDYESKEILLVMIMKGSLCLVADLIRVLKVPTSIEFVHCSSYGERGSVRGRLRVMGLEQIDARDKHVLIVDDIFDSGYTLLEVISRLQAMQPASLKTLVLLSKGVPRKVPYQPDYVLFEIEDRFVVGYGLDYKERFRGLTGVYALLLENLPTQ
jgi:hypoxanthine phosphoribosyltransferase